MLLELVLALALAQGAAPPCPSDKAACKPWERAWWLKYPEAEKPGAAKLGPGPHTLMILNGQHPTRINYKSGAACERAQKSLLQQFKAQNPGLIAGGPSILCVPL